MSHRILVVDDDMTMRLLLREVLEQEGYRVYESINVPNARILLKKTPVDLIISDVMMPHSDGFEFFMEVESLTGRRLPFILISAAAGPEYEEIRQLVGADALFGKPIELELLLCTIQRLLSG